MNISHPYKSWNHLNYVQTALDRELSKCGALQLFDGDPAQAAIITFQWLLHKSEERDDSPERRDTVGMANLNYILLYLLENSEKMGLICDATVENGDFVLTMGTEAEDGKVIQFLAFLLEYMFKRLASFDSKITHDNHKVTVRGAMSNHPSKYRLFEKNLPNQKLLETRDSQNMN